MIKTYGAAYTRSWRSGLFRSVLVATAPLAVLLPTVTAYASGSLGAVAFLEFGLISGFVISLVVILRCLISIFSRSRPGALWLILGFASGGLLIYFFSRDIGSTITIVTGGATVVVCLLASLQKAEGAVPSPSDLHDPDA